MDVTGDIPAATPTATNGAPVTIAAIGTETKTVAATATPAVTAGTTGARDGTTGTSTTGTASTGMPLAKIVGLALGTRSKGLVYKYMGYFGHYTNHYGMYGFGHFLKTIHNARSPISFQTELWLRENLALPSPNRIGDCGPVQRSANTQKGRAQ